MRDRVVAATLAYRQRTGQTVDTWWVPRSRQSMVLELLERAAREQRRVTEAEMTTAKGGHTVMLGRITKPG
jgi:hypothetical protein